MWLQASVILAAEILLSVIWRIAWKSLLFSPEDSSLGGWKSESLLMQPRDLIGGKVWYARSFHGCGHAVLLNILHAFRAIANPARGKKIVDMIAATLTLRDRVIWGECVVTDRIVSDFYLETLSAIPAMSVGFVIYIARLLFHNLPNRKRRRSNVCLPGQTKTRVGVIDCIISLCLPWLQLLWGLGVITANTQLVLSLHQWYPPCG